MGFRPYVSRRRKVFGHDTPPTSQLPPHLSVEAIPFCISTLLTSLTVVSSVNPWLLYFGSASLQFFQVDCCVIQL